MTAVPTDLVDTREMVVVHSAFRREYRQAAALVRSVAPGDTRRAALIADHLAFLNEMLGHHHEGEDRLLWPKLKARVAAELAPVVELMESQHAGIHAAMDAEAGSRTAWRTSAGEPDREALAAALEELSARLEEHLAAEEEQLLPLAARSITHEEWAELGREGMGSVPKNRLTMVFGMFMVDGDPEVLRLMLSTAPPPVRLLVPRLAPRSYRRYSRRLQAA